jgi:D-alanine-D-alanine ligase
MGNTIKVAVIFGGKSAEHKVSLRSAKNIVAALSRDKYEPVLIGIDNDGQWHYHGDAMQLLHSDDPSKIEMNAVMPIILSQNSDHHSVVSNTGEIINSIDVIFPVLHGTYGEDGAIQGFAKLANLPCVGPGILGSAVGMDKDVMKRLLRDAGIGIADFVTARSANRREFEYSNVSKRLGTTLFVKPANMGSSVGISKVVSESDFDKALDLAFQFDNKVIIEEQIVGREIECSVLGNEHPRVSIPGEIIPVDGFYSYERKYLDEHGAALEIPAKLTEAQIKSIQDIALQTYICLELEGMSRVDVFLKENDEIIVNEVNTLPGFTEISMYPSLWEHDGKTIEMLVDELIQLAIKKHTQLNSLSVKY